MNKGCLVQTSPHASEKVCSPNSVPLLQYRDNIVLLWRYLYGISSLLALWKWIQPMEKSRLLLPMEPVCKCTCKASKLLTREKSFLLSFHLLLPSAWGRQGKHTPNVIRIWAPFIMSKESMMKLKTGYAWSFGTIYLFCFHLEGHILPGSTPTT